MFFYHVFISIIFILNFKKKNIFKISHLDLNWMMYHKSLFFQFLYFEIWLLIDDVEYA